ncbi:MAG: DNA replication and repair protein RecF [Gammaproteobacteria bacterium]|nr:DNA replication and repair protein RecF [Gammaproteobacteria bacterium]MDH5629058.1 DNA replication and repair protein RecF [Gammaproteobacteria bacterium]
MFLKAFSFQGIRNLVDSSLQLNPKLNIITGNNGAGKSSLLESICLLTTGRSFRASKYENIINYNSQQFTLFGQTDTDVKLGLGYEQATNKKTIKINQEKINSLSHLASIYPTQILSPESYHMIDSGPSERRKFIDWLLFHVEHQYSDLWKSYMNTLNQRNALLKSSNLQYVKNQINVWDDQLDKYGLLITRYRSNLIEKLSVCFKQIIESLNLTFADNVSLSLHLGYSGDLKDKLKQNLEADFKKGYTGFGAHKSDIKILVNKLSAKENLSRGQKKILINLFFLTQTILLKQKTEKNSLFIIDDFNSELDDYHQKLLLEQLLMQKNVQIFISCLQENPLNWLKKRYNSASMFHVEHGKVSAVTE